MDSLTEEMIKPPPFPSKILKPKDIGLDIPYRANKYKADIPTLVDHLKALGRVAKTTIFKINFLVSSLLKREQTLFKIKAPVLIFGDIHGQFFDLVRFFEKVGYPSDSNPTKYLLLGDYVDRGQFSVQVLLLLYCLKINFPNKIFLLRGNHESKRLVKYYTFESECLALYDEKIFDSFCTTFNYMPLACVVQSSEGSFLCLHGGIGPTIKSLSDISTINRFQDIPVSGDLCDVLWSDPMSEDVIPLVGEKNFFMVDYCENPNRGCSWQYGHTALVEFLSENNLETIIRAHQVVPDGHKHGYTWDTEDEIPKSIPKKQWKQHRERMMIRHREKNRFPTHITVFSAPNYCGTYGNTASVLKLHWDRSNSASDIIEYSQLSAGVYYPHIFPGYKNPLIYATERIIGYMLVLFDSLLFEDLDEDRTIGSEDDGIDSDAEYEHLFKPTEADIQEGLTRMILQSPRGHKLAEGAKLTTTSLLSPRGQSRKTPRTPRSPHSPRNSQSPRSIPSLKKSPKRNSIGSLTSPKSSPHLPKLPSPKASNSHVNSPNRPRKKSLGQGLIPKSQQVGHLLNSEEGDFGTPETIQVRPSNVKPVAIPSTSSGHTSTNGRIYGLKAASKWKMMAGVLRHKSTELEKIKDLTSDHQLPKNLLSQGSKRIDQTLENFLKAVDNDSQNEAHPEFVPKGYALIGPSREERLRSSSLAIRNRLWKIRQLDLASPVVSSSKNEGKYLSSQSRRRQSSPIVMSSSHSPPPSRSSPLRYDDDSDIQSNSSNPSSNFDSFHNNSIESPLASSPSSKSSQTTSTSPPCSINSKKSKDPSLSSEGKSFPNSSKT